MRQTAFGPVCDACVEESHAAVDAEIEAELGGHAKEEPEQEQDWTEDPEPPERLAGL